VRAILSFEISSDGTISKVVFFFFSPAKAYKNVILSLVDGLVAGKKVGKGEGKTREMNPIGFCQGVYFSCSQ
jgi:hypothetical protein